LQTLQQALGAGRFVVTAELGPPADPDPELVRAKARALAGFVDAVNVTDNQAATVKLSPLAAAVLTIEAGLETTLQVTTRDRNLLALQSDLLGAWALGVRAVLALTGDPLSVGPYGSLATALSDCDSLGLTRLIRELNDEGITCLLVEQNVALSLKLADRAYVLENSRIVMQGTGAELLNDDRVRHAYLGIAPAADGAPHHGG